MNKQDESQDLPQCAREYIDLVIRKMRCREQVRREVRCELIDHFIDALADCETDEGRKQCAEELLAGFGDIKMLGRLIKRGKKRCRPLWRKVLSGSSYAVCASALLIILYSAWFFTGKPTLSIDYLARLNEMTRPATVAGENAWPDYEKAIEVYVAAEEVDEGRGFTEAQPNRERLSRIISRTIGKQKYVPYGELESQEQAAITEWIDRNEDAWAHYVEASRKAYCYRGYGVSDEEGYSMLIAILLPHLNEIKNLAKLGIWRSEKLTSENKPQQAAQICLSLIRSGLHWHNNKGMLIEQLVGQAIMRLGHARLISVVAQGGLSSDDMAGIQEELNNIFKYGFPQITVLERLIFDDMVQHYFTDGGPGGGHILPMTYHQFDGGDDKPAYVAASIIHAGRNKTLAVGNKLFDHMEKTIKMSPWEKRAGNVKSAEDILSAYNKQRYAFIWWIMPAIDRVSEIRYQDKALYDAVLTILALKRWEFDKGQLPESLEQLKAEGYLKELPDDPYGEGLLTYIRRNGDFVLYSVADDLDDDGGKQNPEHAWGRREEGGDRVFWPVE